MNAPAVPAQFADATAPGNAATSVNQWRGWCVARFSAVESEVILALSAMRARDPTLPLEQAAGKRYEVLAKALSQDEARNAKVLEALAAFRRHESLRPFLAQGIVDIERDPNSGWIATFALLAVRKNTATFEVRPIRAEEAQDISRELLRDSNRLNNRLRELSETF